LRAWLALKEAGIFFDEEILGCCAWLISSKTPTESEIARPLARSGRHSGSADVTPLGETATAH
jgi:hypothetical protein